MLHVLVGSLLLGRSFACTSIAVGKDASSSGYPIITHSDDSGPTTSDFRWIRVPRKTWPEGSLRPTHYYHFGYPRVVVAERSPEYAPVNGQKESLPLGYIPQVRETFGYWDTEYGVQNEKGLSIGESTCTARTAGWPATPDRPYGYNKIGIEDMSKIALERCETARCAVQTMGDIAVKLGFYGADAGKPEAPAFSGSGEALNVGDAIPGEVWVFHVMTGKNNASAIWAAQRIPADHVAPIANAFTIRKMRLDDPENFLYSEGLTDLAVEQGWWSPEDEDTPNTFDFFGAYGYTPESEHLSNANEFYSGRRMWRVWDLLSPEESKHVDPNRGHLPQTKDPYPTSLRAPKGSVTPKMVMDVHRDHYEGTPYDLTKGMAAGPHGSPNRYNADRAVVGQWERAISMYRTSWSFVLEAKPHGRGISWFGYDAPHGTAYLPFYGAATGQAPEAWRSHYGKQSVFNMSIAWWAFQLVNQYSDLNFELINKAVRAKADKVELDAMEKIAKWEADVAGLSEAQALGVLSSKTNAFAEATLAEWWQLAFDIFAKYGRYVVTFNETDGPGVDVMGQAYPSWWLQSPEVGYATWSSNGPYIGVLDLPAHAKVTALMENPSDSWSVVVAVWGFSMCLAVVVAFQIGARKGYQRGAGADVYIAQP